MTSSDDYTAALPRKRMTTAALFTDASGRVLPVDRVHTGRDLRAALAEVPEPDDHFELDLTDALGDVTDEPPDPWADA